MKRNPSIEMLRCLLMFGIVLQHCTGKGVVRLPWLGLSLNFCVVGFVFISGYFGIKFSWRKLLSLYGVAIVCALIGALVQFIVVGDVHILLNACTYLRWYWFLHAYAVLMMVSPILNLVSTLRGRDLMLALAPTFILVFGWSYCYQIGHLRPFIFEVPGLGAFSPLTLIGIYLAARLFKMSSIEDLIPAKWVVSPFLMLLPIAAIGLAPYNSVFALIMAAALFIIFKRWVKCPEWVCVIAPSMFPIYLLHETPIGWLAIRNFVVGDNLGGGAHMLIVAIFIFMICLTIDMMRRLSWNLAGRLMRR